MNGVAIQGGIALMGIVQHLCRKLAEKFVHFITARRGAPQQGFADQCQQNREGCTGDSLGGFTVKGAAKDRKLAQNI